MRSRVRAIKTTKRRASREKTEPGSGNVFADLGLPDAEERLLKAKLASKIAELIEIKGWTQTQTAERVGLDQPKVSHLLRGRLSGFSADRLDWLVETQSIKSRHDYLFDSRSLFLGGAQLKSRRSR